MDFAEQILARLEVLGLNINQAEARAGFPQGYIRGVVRDDAKRAVPNVEKAARIAESLGLELYLGPPTEREPITVAVVDDVEFARIPVHDVELAAGAGARNHDEPVIDHLAFWRDWLNRIGVAASNARLVRVRGDSMMPTLRNGDLVMLDTKYRSVPITLKKPGRQPSIYAFINDNGECQIKRIEHSKVGVLVLHSENVAYPPEVMTDIDAGNFRVIGKVVWWGHTERD